MQAFAGKITNDKELQQNLTKASFFTASLSSLDIDPATVRDYIWVEATAVDDQGAFKVQLVVKVSVGYIPEFSLQSSPARRLLLQENKASSNLPDLDAR